MSAAHYIIAVALLLPGCGLFDSTTDGGTTTSTGGFGQPALEVTVAGVHAGPVTPDSGSAASLVDIYDSTTGSLSQSSFQLSASATSIASACSINLERYGAVAPLGLGTWQLADTIGSSSDDGVAAPLGSPTVSESGGSWQCAGDGCGDTALTISAIDSLHVEGYFSGTFANADGDAAVVCSFYLPMSAYNP